jgi:GlcNAc-PI de-N-acetylase
VSRRSLYSTSALSLLTALVLAACSTSPSPASTVPTAAVAATDPAALGEQSLTPWLCADIQDQYVVAHEDDDLLFMNPDLQAAIRLGHCTLTSFLTAGNDNKQGASGLTYMKQREEGIRQAYAKMAGQRNSWLEGNFFINNRKVKLFALSGDLRVVLLFFRLSDGADRDYNKTLAALNSAADGAITLQSIDGSNSYTKSQLVKTLADIMKYAQPKYLHIQDSSPSPFITDKDLTVGDHVDHVVSARLVEAAEQQYTQPHMVIRYRDYNINTETASNLSAADQASKLSTFNVYAAKDPVICPQGNGCITVNPELSLYSFYGWTQRQYFHQDDNQQGSVVRGAGGQLQAFVIGTRSSTLKSIAQSAPGSGTWSSWQDLKGNFSAAPTVSVYKDGRLAAFVHSNYGTMFYSGQNDDQSWTSWRELGGQGVSDAASATDASGRLRAVSISNSGQIFEMIDTTSRGAWSSWRPVGNPFYAASNPALALGQDGRLTLLALDSRGALRVNSQAAGSTSWPNSWQNLGGSFASAPVVTRNADGRLEVFLRGTDQGLYHFWQTATGQWSAPEALGNLNFDGQPVVSLAGGLLSVAVRDNLGHLSLLQQLSGQPGSAWSARQDLGSPTTNYGSSLSAVIGMGSNADGTLALMARADNGSIYSNSQIAAGWSGWSNLGN